jgi:hypothetical protein
MTDPKNPKSIALESFRLIETGDAQLAERIIAPGFRNQEADDDPTTLNADCPAPQDSLPPANGCVTPSPICVLSCRRRWQTKEW